MQIEPMSGGYSSIRIRATEPKSALDTGARLPIIEVQEYINRWSIDVGAVRLVFDADGTIYIDGQELIRQPKKQ
ncbi:MAG TPA: hypothetical protein PLW50_00090 [Smithellaceae bacterium]|nr:hypothetical protein [Smithellaceae bacterium]